ncbi:MAG: sigma 54-interacting transcriptional regulator [Bilophila wadsworthia]
MWSTIKGFSLIPTPDTLTCCDAIEFLTKAKQYDTNIGVVPFLPISPRWSRWPHTRGEPHRPSGQQPRRYRKALRERDKGMKVLVGGGHAVQWAQKLGLHGVLHTVSADGVIQVLNEADRILNAIISERSKDARVRTMLNALKDGAISLNEQGKILEYNLPAQKMFANGESTMKSIRTFLQDTGIIEAVQQQLTWSGESKKYEKKQYLCNIIPAYSNDIYCGASVIIQDASHIQSLEHKMRRELHAKGHVARYTLKDVVGHSAEMRSLVEHAELYANSPSSIFIYGESGTGKEIFAQGIHRRLFRNGPLWGSTVRPVESLLVRAFRLCRRCSLARKKAAKWPFRNGAQRHLFLDEIGEIPPRKPSRACSRKTSCASVRTPYLINAHRARYEQGSAELVRCASSKTFSA